MFGKTSLFKTWFWGLCGRAGGNRWPARRSNRWPEGGGVPKWERPFFQRSTGENRQTRCIILFQNIDTPSPQQLGLYSRAGGIRWLAREEQQVARGGGVPKWERPFFQRSTGENRQTRCINVPQSLDTPGSEQLGLCSRAGGNRWPARRSNRWPEGGACKNGNALFFKGPRPRTVKHDASTYPNPVHPKRAYSAPKEERIRS